MYPLFYWIVMLVVTPLRLPLGDLALSAIRTKLGAQLRDLERSNVVSASTSFTAG